MYCIFVCDIYDFMYIYIYIGMRQRVRRKKEELLKVLNAIFHGTLDRFIKHVEYMDKQWLFIVSNYTWQPRKIFKVISLSLLLTERNILNITIHQRTLFRSLFSFSIIHIITSFVFNKNYEPPMCIEKLHSSVFIYIIIFLFHSKIFFK